jgi:hypothetical protein
MFSRDKIILLDQVTRLFIKFYQNFLRIVFEVTDIAYKVQILYFQWYENIRIQKSCNDPTWNISSWWFQFVFLQKSKSRQSHRNVKILMFPFLSEKTSAFRRFSSKWWEMLIWVGKLTNSKRFDGSSMSVSVGYHLSTAVRRKNSGWNS